MTMTVTLDQKLAAAREARRIVQSLRGIPGSRGERYRGYSDRQIWQAVLDAGSADPTLVSLQLLHRVMEHDGVPECPYELDEEKLSAQYG